MLSFNEITNDYYGKCVEITNEKMQMIVTVDRGPRIIHYSLVGKNNLLCQDLSEKSTMSGDKFAEVFGDKKWYLYGGHRLWLSPEHDPKSYYPDNDAVSYQISQNTLTLTPPPQKETGLQFELKISFSNETTDVKIEHIITNIAGHEQALAPWALTVTDKNGVAIIPQSTEDTKLLSNRNLSLWPYTDFSDDRMFISNKYITVLQNSSSTKLFKIGINNVDGWLAVKNYGQLFIKRFAYNKNALYPDNNCNCECFTNDFMMEVESLGELKTLKHGESNHHFEEWSLKECDCDLDRHSEQSIDDFVKKCVM